MLRIFSEGRAVGSLESAPPGVTFRYARPWLNGGDAFAISTTMPLQADVYPPEAATPWFANLLPEDQQLEAVGRVLGRSTTDVYGLLEQIGGDTAGALTIGTQQRGGKAGYRTLSSTELAEVIDQLPARPLLAGTAGVTMSLAGAQAKIALAKLDGDLALPLRGAASTHILKRSSGRMYATVENELLCMTLAAEVGLEVAPVTMGSAGVQKYLLVERYDRHRRAGHAVTRNHQEDFCQALGFYPSQKYEAKKGPNHQDVFGVIDAHSPRRVRDRLEMLGRVIFACCIGDTDRHGKNHSMLLTGGRQGLSPGYDFMSALLYEGFTLNFAMKVGGGNRAEQLRQLQWRRFAEETKLAPAATVARVEELATAVAAQASPVAARLADTFAAADREALRTFAEHIAVCARSVAANCRRGAPG